MKGVLHMSRNKGLYPLPDGCTEAEALSAMVREAKQRGISYGQLVANTTEGERLTIIRAYYTEKRKKERRAGK